MGAGEGCAVCLPGFKAELIWHPGGSPPQSRGAAQGDAEEAAWEDTAAGQGLWLPPASVTDTPTSAARGTGIQLKRRVKVG